MLVSKYLNWVTVLRATIKTDEQEIKIKKYDMKFIRKLCGKKMINQEKGQLLTMMMAVLACPANEGLKRMSSILKTVAKQNLLAVPVV